MFTASRRRPMERGERRCKTCGRVHDAYWRDEARPSAGYSWADPDDGHPYRPEDWETIARRLGVRRGA